MVSVTRCQISNMRYDVYDNDYQNQVSDIEYHIWSRRYRVSNVEYYILNIRYQFCQKKIFAEENFPKKNLPKFWPVSKIRNPLRLSFMAVAIPFGGIILFKN